MKKWIPSEVETAAEIGKLLLLTQHTEHSIVALIGTVYPDGKPTWKEIEKLNKEMLGRLVTKLKERVEMPDVFIGLLEGFLEHRNLFVHGLSQQSWFDMRSEGGRDKIWDFIESYSKHLVEVLRVVEAALFKAMEDIGMPETEHHKELEKSGYLEEIKGYYQKSQFAFGKKKT